MAETVTNLKVRFGADTKKFQQDMDSGKAAVSGFTSQAGNAFSQFASLFGVNIGAINAALGAANKQAAALGAGFKGAAAGSGVLSGALRILKLALISTGVGAIVVAFGSLISYFTKTQRGADSISRVMAGLGATFNVIVDRISAFGEVLVKAFNDPKKAVADLWEAIKTNFVNRIKAVGDIFTGLKELGAGTFKYIAASIKNIYSDQAQALEEAKKQMADGAKDIGGAYVQALSGLDSAQQSNLVDWFKEVGTEIKNEASSAYKLEAALQALEEREIALITVQEERRKKIEELRLAAKDETKSAEERRKAITDAIALEKQSLADEISLQKERVRILQEQTDLGESTRDDYRKLAEEQGKLSSLQGDSARTLRRLQTEYNTLTNEIEANSAAILKNRQKESGDMKALTPVTGVNIDAGSLEEDKLILFQARNEMAAEKIQSVWVDATEAINESFSSLAVGFGESLGALMSGSAGLSDIGSMVLGSLADLMIQVGKMAIGAGIAISGIKKALMSLNPAIAIAAGVALVALGSAIKGGLANAANGGGGGTYSSNSSVYDSSSSTSSSLRGSTSASYNQSINLIVSGEFKLKGKDLVASVNNETKVARIRS